MVEHKLDLCGVIGYFLLYLVNTSLPSGVVPSELKTSVILPIPRVAKPQNLGSSMDWQVNLALSSG